MIVFKIVLLGNFVVVVKLTLQLDSRLPCGRVHQFDRYFYFVVYASIPKN